MTRYDVYLKEPTIDAICFMSKASTILVTLKTKTGYVQIDTMSTPNLADWIKELDRDGLSEFQLGVNFTAKLTSHNVIQRFGKPVVLTYIYARGRHLAALSSTLDKQEIKASFYEKERYKTASLETVKQARKDHDQTEIAELEVTASTAQKNYEILTGVYPVALSDTEFFEFELRIDPLCNVLGWGTFIPFIIPQQVSINGLMLIANYYD